MLPLSMFGPIDAVLMPYVEYVLLVLVLANILTRKLAHDTHVRQARKDGAEAIARFRPHSTSNLLLVLLAFYYTTVNFHGGVIVSMFVLGTFVSDFFEFEARKIEARKDEPLDRPKSAIVASVFVLLYVAYVSLFFVVEPLWDAVV